jgi:hypothetical protein
VTPALPRFGNSSLKFNRIDSNQGQQTPIHQSQGHVFEFPNQHGLRKNSMHNTFNPTPNQMMQAMNPR